MRLTDMFLAVGMIVLMIICMNFVIVGTTGNNIHDERLEAIKATYQDVNKTFSDVRQNIEKINTGDILGQIISLPGAFLGVVVSFIKTAVITLPSTFTIIINTIGGMIGVPPEILGMIISLLTVYIIIMIYRHVTGEGG